VRLNGVLAEWTDSKACGFIDCSDPSGKKLFCHKSDFALHFADGEGPAIGTEVNFVLGHDPKSGKQRAQDVKIGRASGKGSFDGGRLVGSLTEWNPEKACGFIQCPEAHRKFFAHKTEFEVQLDDGEEPQIGSQVSFLHGLDPKSGRERARSIRFESTENPQLFGTISEWREEKACGFIEADTGKRYFAHKTEFVEQFDDLAPPVVGSRMSFVPGLDAKSGRERATEIRFVTGSEGGGKRTSDLKEMPDGKRPRR